MELDLKRLLYLLYGSVALLRSPSSIIEAWPNGTSLRFASPFRALGVCEHTLVEVAGKFYKHLQKMPANFL